MAEETVAAATPHLKANVIGPVGLLALVVGITSPAIGLYALWGPMETAAGPVAPLVFIGALVIILPTVLSYASLNRYAPTAGAAASWLWTTVNPTVGLLAGLVMITYLIMGATTVPILFGLFLRDLMDWLHLSAPGMAVLVAGIVLQSALVAWICLRGAAMSVKATILLMLVEMAVVFALSATILAVRAGQPGGVNLGPFNPAHASHGLAGFWSAIILGILAFSGFDAAVTAAEEAQGPRENLPRMLILGILVISLFWAGNAWVLTLSTPPAQVADYNAQGLTAITPVAHAYWGAGSLAIILTAFTGLTAIYIGCVQGASRLVFALARHRLLPSVFASLKGESRVPHWAVLFVVGACAVMALLSLALLQNGLDSFTWWSGALVFFAAITFTGINLANLLHFRRVQPEHFHLIRNLLVPVVGIGLNLYLLYAAFFASLWSAPFRTGRSIVIGCLILFAVEAAATLWVRLARPRRLASKAPIGVEPGA